MTSEMKEEIISFETSELMNINPKESTLPIDTVSEWTKGFALVNEIIHILSESTYEEDFEDISGEIRSRLRIHPMLLPFLKERRALMDQFYKVSGGEAVNEVKKEVSKSLANAIFNFKMDRKANENNRKKVIEILEVEHDVNEDIKNEN
jgi:hypothetical protein